MSSEHLGGKKERLPFLDPKHAISNQTRCCHHCQGDTRKRPWGRYAAKIQGLGREGHVRLRASDTDEDAMRACHAATRRLCGTTRAALGALARATSPIHQARHRRSSPPLFLRRRWVST
ncbi:hypothetical protein U1Q18_013459 [Sarracenia purpurea var. burkii]